MRILVVGGTGHIGSYLVPRLALAGHSVHVVARTPEPRYGRSRLGWQNVEWIVADRRLEEKDGSFGKRMSGIDADVVVDTISFTAEQNRMMVDAFAGRVQLFIHIGSIWVYGPTRTPPTRECDARRPLGPYGQGKMEIEKALLSAWRTNGFPATIVHPGHISGIGWLPIDPQGTRNGTGVYQKLARGETVHLPGMGLGMLHHVHADDIAAMCMRMIDARESAVGESFNCVSPQAMTLVACCEYVAALFGREPKLEFVSQSEMAKHIGQQAADAQESHVAHSSCCSIEKARRLLGWEPRYTSQDIFREFVETSLAHGELEA